MDVKNRKFIKGRKPKTRVYDFTADLANSDFIRSARLAKSNKKADKEKLFELGVTPMKTITEN